MISIIIPYCNKKNYIEQTIASILDQTFKDFEILIIYDDEKKRDLNFLENLIKIDNRIKLIINEKNLGAGESRNKGIKLANGEFIGAWALTETGTGSDALRMNTTAVKDGDKWIINGSKNFITHGISSAVVVVIARTGDKSDTHGVSAFIVDKSCEGYIIGEEEKKMGIKGSSTTTLFTVTSIPSYASPEKLQPNPKAPVETETGSIELPFDKTESAVISRIRVQPIYSLIVPVIDTSSPITGEVPVELYT